MSEAVAEIQALPAAISPDSAARPAETAPAVRTATEPTSDNTRAVTPEDSKDLRAKLEQAEKSGVMKQVRFQWETNEDGNVIIKIKDAETDKVIKQIPPEGQVEFARKLRDFLGILFDEEA